MKKVAYQGIKGAYSYIASEYLFPESSLVGKGSFEDVYQALVSGEVEYAVLPIENTVIGSIFEVYDLLFEHSGNVGNISEVKNKNAKVKIMVPPADLSGVSIVGEVLLRVDHNLLGLPGAKATEAREVYSHNKALKQCQKRLNELTPARAVVWEDTAAAAAYVALKGDPKVLAIASLRAAEEYGLEVLARRIQSEGENYTRFVVLRGNKTNRTDRTYGDPGGSQVYKTSLVFAAAHKPGSLMECLAPFGEAGLNLTKIESRPLLGKHPLKKNDSPWQYLFYLDFEHGGNVGDISDLKSQISKPKSVEPAADLDSELGQILKQIEPHTQVLRVLGTYPKGETIGEEDVGN